MSCEYDACQNGTTDETRKAKKERHITKVDHALKEEYRAKTEELRRASRLVNEGSEQKRKRPVVVFSFKYSSIGCCQHQLMI